MGDKVNKLMAQLRCIANRFANGKVKAVSMLGHPNI